MDYQRLSAVPGWFRSTDQHVFSWLLGFQNRKKWEGTLLELGTYLGKSAILLGDFLKDAEKFVVCDLFDEVATADDVSDKERSDYRGLSQAKFEDNYLQFHSQLPEIIRDFSSKISQVLPNNTCRFVHIDGSHEYEHVSVDADSAKNLLSQIGVVAFDDYRSAHTPGVAATVWKNVLDSGLQPICITGAKFYGTWGSEADAYKAEIIKQVARTNGATCETQTVYDGIEIIRILNIESSPSLSV